MKETKREIPIIYELFPVKKSFVNQAIGSYSSINEGKFSFQVPENESIGYVQPYLFSYLMNYGRFMCSEKGFNDYLDYYYNIGVQTCFGALLREAAERGGVLPKIDGKIITKYITEPKQPKELGGLIRSFKNEERALWEGQKVLTTRFDSSRGGQAVKRGNITFGSMNMLLGIVDVSGIFKVRKEVERLKTFVQNRQ